MSSERRLPCEHWLASRNQQVVASLRSKRVVFFLEPDELCFQVANALLEAAHLGNHPRIWTADVAEYSLRHRKRSSTQSDQSEHAHKNAETRGRVRGRKYY